MKANVRFCIAIDDFSEEILISVMFVKDLGWSVCKTFNSDFHLPHSHCMGFTPQITYLSDLLLVVDENFTLLKKKNWISMN